MGTTACLSVFLSALWRFKTGMSTEFFFFFFPLESQRPVCLSVFCLPLWRVKIRTKNRGRETKNSAKYQTDLTGRNLCLPLVAAIPFSPFVILFPRGSGRPPSVRLSACPSTLRNAHDKLAAAGGGGARNSRRRLTSWQKSSPPRSPATTWRWDTQTIWARAFVPFFFFPPFFYFY